MDVLMIDMKMDEQRIDTNESIVEAAEKIAAQFGLLDGRRRYMFLEWLSSHNCQIFGAQEIREGITFWSNSLSSRNCQISNARDIREGLIYWFNYLEIDGVQCEYNLILNEIVWWRNLDEPSLARMIVADLQRSCV